MGHKRRTERTGKRQNRVLPSTEAASAQVHTQRELWEKARLAPYLTKQAASSTLHPLSVSSSALSFFKCLFIPSHSINLACLLLAPSLQENFSQAHSWWLQHLQQHWAEGTPHMQWPGQWKEGKAQLHPKRLTTDGLAILGSSSEAGSQGIKTPSFTLPLTSLFLLKRKVSFHGGPVPLFHWSFFFRRLGARRVLSAPHYGTGSVSFWSLNIPSYQVRKPVSGCLVGWHWQTGPGRMCATSQSDLCYLSHLQSFWPLQCNTPGIKRVHLLNKTARSLKTGTKNMAFYVQRAWP